MSDLAKRARKTSATIHAAYPAPAGPTPLKPKTAAAIARMKKASVHVSMLFSGAIHVPKPWL
jgi:hypothetical protein